MDQPSLLDLADDKNTSDLPPLDPEKYVSDRADCRFPDMHPQSSYTYGCRCIGCYKFNAARWARRKREGHQPHPCKADGCDQPRRRVQGARYCEEHARLRQYIPVTKYVDCPLCGTTHPQDRNAQRPYCGPCNKTYARISRAAARHHVPVETLTRWILDPRCALCRRPLYLKGARTSGEAGASIDHDHACCPGPTSCGRCIRGLTCHSCNLRLGAHESLVAEVGLATLATYLTANRPSL